MRSLFVFLCLLGFTPFCVAQLPSPTPGKATLVFYRPPQFARAGINFTIRANGTELCRLSNKRYFISKLDPGQVEITSVAGGLNIPDKDGLTLNLEAGKNYYIQGDVKVRFMSDKLTLTEVTESTAQKNLPNMKPDNCMTASN